MDKICDVSGILFILISCARSGLVIPGPLTHMHAPPPDTPSAEPEAVPPAAPTAEAPDPLLEALPDPLDEALLQSPIVEDPGRQDLVVSSARALLDRRNIVVNGERVRHDCIGMVAAAYTMSGMDITHSISDLYDQAASAGLAHRRKVPLRGDIAFFDNSYDKNRNGVRDDPLTHVAIVERVYSARALRGASLKQSRGARAVQRKAMARF